MHGSLNMQNGKMANTAAKMKIKPEILFKSRVPSGFSWDVKFQVFY